MPIRIHELVVQVKVEGDTSNAKPEQATLRSVSGDDPLTLAKDVLELLDEKASR